MAANVISGCAIIFGGKTRKGNWIEVGSMLGEVAEIYLRATKVRTRDNIESLVTNPDIISSTMVNYSLFSPLIHMELPVGVSYKSDPRQVRSKFYFVMFEELARSGIEIPFSQRDIQTHSKAEPV